MGINPHNVILRCQSCSRFFQLLVLFTFPVLWACGSSVTVPALAPEEIPSIEAAGNFPHKKYRIEPGDTIQISYTFHADMNQGELVRPDGKITAKMVGEVVVAGMTTAQLEKLLVERTSDRLRDPEVGVSVTKFAEKSVYIGGEIGRPGKVSYRKGLTPLQAIIEAGGFEVTAQTDSVILIRTGNSKNEIISRKLNLADVITDGIKEPLYLAPHDVVYVPRTAIGDANIWVKQHITDLFPFLTKGASSMLFNAF